MVGASSLFASPKTWDRGHAMDEDNLNVENDPVEGFINVELNPGSPGYSAS